MQYFTHKIKLKERTLCLLINQRTGLPCYLPLVFWANKYSTSPYSTQFLQMLSIGLFYQFYQDEYGANFDAQFINGGYIVTAVHIEALYGFYEHLVAIKPDDVKAAYTHRQIFAVTRFFEFLIVRYINNSHSSVLDEITQARAYFLSMSKRNEMVKKHLFIDGDFDYHSLSAIDYLIKEEDFVEFLNKNAQNMHNVVQRLGF